MLTGPTKTDYKPKKRCWPTWVDTSFKLQYIGLHFGQYIPTLSNVDNKSKILWSMHYWHRSYWQINISCCKLKVNLFSKSGNSVSWQGTNDCQIVHANLQPSIPGSCNFFCTFKPNQVRIRPHNLLTRADISPHTKKMSLHVFD